MAPALSPLPHGDAQYFTLEVTSTPKASRLIMHLFTHQVTTLHFSHLSKLLRKKLPCIFGCMCFNQQNLPFKEELKDTEIGHLYEHILLEYLAKLKSKSGDDQSDVAGVTSWNWNRQPRGTFNIVVNVGKKDLALLEVAITQTNQLMQEILNYQETHVN